MPLISSPLLPRLPLRHAAKNIATMLDAMMRACQMLIFRALQRVALSMLPVAICAFSRMLPCRACCYAIQARS